MIITGHQRSGTTLLWTLCNQHPEILLTLEFGNFKGINASTPAYLSQLGLWAWRRGSRLQPILYKPNLKPWECRLRNHAFFSRYAWRILRAAKPRVDAALVTSVLQEMLGHSGIVGDKYPHYIHHMDNLVGNRGLSVLVIYRDCRDVVNSVLEKVRTDWSSFAFAKQINSAPKIALKWKQAIEAMERCADQCHVIRYEDLVEHPEETLAELGGWLGVDPRGFPAGWVRKSSVGKYRSGLTAGELKETLDIAGPTMQRLGYVLE